MASPHTPTDTITVRLPNVKFSATGPLGVLVGLVLGLVSIAAAFALAFFT